MDTTIIYAMALVLEQIDATTFTLVVEPIKMVFDECVKAALAVNLDTSHPYIMSCTPFTEAAVGV